MTAAAGTIMAHRRLSGDGDSAYDTLVKTTMSGTMFYLKGPKNGSVIAEDIVPVSLAIINDYFDNEAASLPNGDTALLVRGDLSQTHKATVAAPTLSPVDVFNVGDVTANNDWSMSVWLKMPDTGGGTYGQILLGCSTAAMSAIANNARNTGMVGVLDVQGINSLRFSRDPLNNSAGSGSTFILQGTVAHGLFYDKWHLYTFNFSAIAGGLITMDVYIDSFATTIRTDTADAAGASGSYAASRLVHIGAARTAGTGWMEAWRMAKWAFHDHALTQAERATMVQTMRGPVVYTDDFNRADGSITAGNDNWTIILSSGVVIVSNKVTRVSSTTNCAIGYYADHGTSEMYAQCVVHQAGTLVAPMVRVLPYSTATQTGCYKGGWNDVAGAGLGRWEIYRGSSLLANGTNGANDPGTPPYTVRTECRTVSGNAEITVKCNGSTMLTYTDSSGSKNVIDRCSGVYAQGKTGEDFLFDDFESGSL